ncbi:MAG: metallophosphoesterase family protein [bacterium]|nr:metallophosphoesterase family protein [bacterium]
MRFAIIADIHGNMPALEAVLDEIQRHTVDGLMVAGDVIGGAQPLETLQLLRSSTNWIIRGNGENYYLTYDTGNAPETWRWSQQWASMRWVYHRLTRSTLEFLASLPERHLLTVPGIPSIRLVHGSLHHPTALLLPEHDPACLDAYKHAGLLSPTYRTASLRETMHQLRESALVCGHSHIPWSYHEHGRLIVNAGSVGQPLNGDPRAQYTILTWQQGGWQTAHYAIPYHLNRVRATYRSSGLLAEGGALARAMLLGTETGRNIAGCFLSYAYGLATDAGYPDCDVVPDHIWEHATGTFDWEHYSSFTGGMF